MRAMSILMNSTVGVAGTEGDAECLAMQGHCVCDDNNCIPLYMVQKQVEVGN